MGEIPDALMIPESLKSGARMSDRVASIAELAEPLLVVNRSKGERAYVRIQPGGRLFVTKDVRDTILFPRNHHRCGQPRYHWATGDDGIDRGYLVAT
jgi:hypothetical protein